MIFKIWQYAPLSVLKQIYYSFFYPYLNYGILLWGNACSTNIEPLRILQRKAVRAMLNKKWDTHSPPLFYKLQLLTIDDLFKLHTSLFMYDIFHKSISQSFLDMFTPLTEVHRYETRQKSTQTFYLKKHRTNFKSRFISINGIGQWEKIPIEIRSENKHIFKKKLQDIFLNTYANL